MRHPTFKQLQAVARIAEHGTVTAAAERLNLSPSAVSITLKQVEQDFGLKLFERTENGFKPTDAGKEVIMAEARIASILGELAETTSALKGGRSGHVSFAVVSTAKYFAPFLLSTFEKRHPRIDMSLIVGNRGEVLARLSDYSVDMALIGRPPQDIDVAMQEIGPHPHVVIAEPGHPLARKKHIPAASLSRETMLVREVGSGTRLLTERLLSELGATPKLGMEISSNETIKQAVMAGLGIALLSYHTVAHEVEDGRLAILKVEGTPVVRKWYMVRNKRKNLLPSGQALWNFIEAEGASYLPLLKNLRHRIRT
jgi:LysR family transcriptional regulator, low CO2-responsive transcriptional regulator